MELEDAVNGMTRAASKEMSKTGAKALNRMKMTLKKNNPTYAAAIEAYRKDPDAVEKDENEVRREAKKAAHSSAKAAAAGGAEDSDEDEVVIGRMGVQVKKKVVVDEDEDDDDDDDDDDDEEEEEEDEEDDEEDAAVKDEEVDEDEDDDEFDDDDDDDEDDDEEDEAYKGLTGRAKWVKREIVGKSKDEKMAEKDSRRADQDAKLRAKKERAAKKEEELAKTGAVASSSAAGTAATTVVDLAQLESKSFDIEAAVQAKKWSRTMLEEEVQRVLAMRGRKGADTKALVAYLGALANKSLVFGPHVAIPTIVQAIGARFSLSASRLDAFLDRPSWKRSLRDVSTVLSIFEANPELRLGHVTSEDLAELMSKKSSKKGGMLGKAVLVSNGPDAAIESPTASGDSTSGQQGGGDDFVAAPTKRRTATAALAAAAAAAANEIESAAQAAAIARAEADLADPNVVRIVGDLSVLINGLQDEYIKSLQNMDPHKQDYVLRISDESALTQVAERAFAWYSRKATEQAERDAALNIAAPISTKANFVAEKTEQLQTLEAGATRLACLRIEHMYYKHDSIAYMLRVAAATADKRAEVASLAAAAAMQALEEARRAAVEAGRTSVQVSSTTSVASSSAATNAATPTSPRAGDVLAAASAAAAAGKDAQEAASKAVSAAANASVVGESAALLAIASAKARGKKGFASAAGVVAKAVVVELSRREGGLLSGAAVETSRSATDMETLADVEAAKALSDAENAGVDLGDLRMIPVANGAPGEVVGVPVIDSQATIASLAHYIYRRGDSRTKNKAVLCHVFHHALHDRFHAARDLLVMSRCQDSIASMQQEARMQNDNVRVQILYNRALAMLGICAFRCGLYDQSHECLSEICGSGHSKELLAQGLIMFRYGQAAERDAETEREERRRLVPYHMHINVELADACHLTSAVLLEVPNIAAAEFDPKRREISKCFRKYLDILDSKSFVGPPETTRDSIMLAALALAEGEWKRASELITSLKVWHLWGSGRGQDQIKTRLVQAIKEAGLVTFLHSYSQFYESLSRDSLCEMFELPASSVQGIVSKLMYSGEIEAKWDQPTSTIVVLRSPPSKLQSLALDFANHVASLADSNEMLLHNRSGLGLERGGPGGIERAPGSDRRGGGGGGGDGQYRRSRGNLSGGRGGGGRSSTFVEGRGGGGFGRGGGRGGNFASARREFKQRGY